jgi:hypothetical protein
VSFEVDVMPEETVTGFTPKNGEDQDGGGVAERVTEPAKLLRLVIETVEFAFAPCEIVREDGVDEIP